MANIYENNLLDKHVPDVLCDETVKRIKRIESIHSVIGTMFLRNGVVEMFTVPETVSQILYRKLPDLNSAMHRALAEINNVFIMKIISNLLKDSRDEWLAKTISIINHVNPMVDRIMDDDSVEGVVMTNKEGNPILTSISVTSATIYASNLHSYGLLAQHYVKELDIFDDLLVIRLKTKKVEVMLAPDPEFNIIVVQHSRHKKKEKK